MVDEVMVLRGGVRSTYQGRSLVFRGDLLCHSCDLPAHSLVNNQQSVGAKWGCMKCMLEGRTECRRQVYGEVRRWLPAEHPYRTDNSFGLHELRPAPERRTNKATCEAAVIADRQSPPGFDAVVDTKGVKGRCALDELSYDYTAGTHFDTAHMIKENIRKVMCELV